MDTHKAHGHNQKDGNSARQSALYNCYPSSDVVGSESTQIQQLHGKGRMKKDNLQNSSHNILILGETHFGGMATKLRHNLGLEKPGADWAAISTSGMNDIRDFSKRDLVIVWDDTNDLRRKETDRGLIQIRNSLNENTHTNVLVG
jgi:hypothetical protein